MNTNFDKIIQVVWEFSQRSAISEGTISLKAKAAFQGTNYKEYRYENCPSNKLHAIHNWFYSLQECGIKDEIKKSQINDFLLDIGMSISEISDLTNKVYKQKMPKNKSVFISHSSKYKQLIDKFIDEILIGGLEIKSRDIFCTSAYGTEIKSGEYWRESIKDNLCKCEVVFLIITPNFKESEVCICEMGAAWAIGNIVIPLIVDPINYRNVGIIYEPKQIEKLISKDSLNRIKDILVHDLMLTENTDTNRWESKRDGFIELANSIISSAKFPIPMDRVNFEAMSKVYPELKEKIQNANKEINQLKQALGKLSLTKDRTAVIEVAEEYSDVDFSLESVLEAFIEMLKESLKPFNPIICAKIFSSLTGKNLNIDTYFNDVKETIKDAIARGYLNIDGNLDWLDPELEKIKDAYDNLTRFISDINKDSHLWNSIEYYYKENYSTRLDPSNLKFWENVMGIEFRTA